VIHVYAFAERLDELPDSSGLDGAPLERRSVDGVTAVFSRRTATTSGETLRDDALAHGAVVEALMERAAAVVPVRFGEVVADEEVLDASVLARVATLRRTFDSIRGCVEVSLRVWERDAPAAVAPATGAEYMRARAAADAGRRGAVDALHRELSAIARAVSVRGGVADARQRLAAAYLVPAGRIERVRSLVAAFAEAHDDLTVLCTGPWPAFSFVERA
jgi:hypothetical protein